ncbi:MAG: glycosyltransferase [Candidatus Eremiobacteraeota bacterium]|nr:glycosyltransferase [Candidatus Eremiobacteraeota bacterium]
MKIQYLLDKLSAAAALVYAWRSLYIAGHSNYRLDPETLCSDLPSLSIIVPARNEERQIERCVQSLLSQRYPDLEVIVVDDQSSDATADILAGIASRDSRLHVIRGQPLPQGWIGKPWALMQGARAARGDLLLFTDADTEHEPLASASSASYLQAFVLDVLSVLTDQELVTTAERAILPTILWTIGFAVGSLDALNDPRRPQNALFNGQYIMFRRNAYFELGGHEAVRGEIAEDFELAHLVKQRRYRSHMVGANGLIRTRMYRSFSEIWRGFGKNLALGARQNPAALIAGAAFLALVAPLGQIAALRALSQRRYAAALFDALSTGAAIAATEVGMRRSRFPKSSALCLPLGLTVMLAILGKSAVAHARGSVEWRGRRYGV